MTRTFLLGGLLIGVVASAAARADIVTDWNGTLVDAIRATPAKHNPGNSTRGIAMTNAAIYDVFQAINRTHTPFKVNTFSPGASLDAAVTQAAYRTISDTYGEQQAMLDSVLGTRLAAIPNGPAKTAGIDLGNLVAQQYINAHANDGHNVPDAYTPTDAPGHWSPDPLVSPPQTGWGDSWADVTPWAMPNSDAFDAVVDLPGLQSQEWVDAFNQAKAYGARNSAVRTADQTAIAHFWAYDREVMGPPPVQFLRTLDGIAAQVGNTPDDNARLYAMASVSMADACIAAWDVKFEDDFWRPITAIRADAAHDDDNPATAEDPNWVYLGAPGDDPNSTTDDFTPPFPAYTSGHATMGGALFKSIELFYGTNDFGLADAARGVDPVAALYTLTSEEALSGGSRNYTRFTQISPLTVGTEDSPEGENAMSRIYLGIHWLFDEVDGMALGNAVATYAASNHFQAVPEPATLVLTLLGAAAVAAPLRRKR